MVPIQVRKSLEGPPSNPIDIIHAIAPAPSDREEVPRIVEIERSYRLTLAALYSTE